MPNFAIEKFIEFYKTRPLINNISVALCLLIPIEDFLVPILIGKIVDSIKERQQWKKHLIILTTVLVTAQIVYFTLSLVDTKLVPVMQNFIRNSMFRDVLESRSEAFAEIQTGQMVGKLVKIPFVITNMTELFKKDIIPYFVGLVVVSVAIFMADRLIGVVVLITVILAFYSFLNAPKSCSKPTSRVEHSMAELDEETEDVMRNSMSVFAANQTESELQRIKVYERNYTKTSWKLLMCTIRHRFLIVFLMAVMLGIVGIRCWNGIIKKTLTVGNLVTIFTSINSMFATLNWLAGRMNTSVFEWGIINSYAKASYKGPQVPTKTDEPTNIHVPEKGLLLYNVVYSVPQKSTPILQGVSLYVRPNQRMAIVGDIGSGKSTLLKLIVRLITPTSGDLYINGISYKNTDAHQVRSQIAYVQQNPTLFNRSIYENITYGVGNVDASMVDKLLTETGLQDVFSGLEQGLNSKAGKNGCNLSGGQRQVVACIRAILSNPQIVVLDEVTSSLDPWMKQRLLGLLEHVFTDKIVIFVTHDKDMMRFATQVVTLRNGIIVSDQHSAS